LSAVIDFGTSGVGDPSCDLAIAWTLFEGKSREAFRAGLPADEAMWARGRGWTLWKALITVAGHIDVNPVEVEKSRYVIDQVLADHARGA
jgi:aminoglycoside phosphotransferase (APT) family kinase protein